MTYERLYKEFANALARMDRKRGAELLQRDQADVDGYFDEFYDLKRQCYALKRITPGFSAKLDQQFDRALGDLTTRALEELGFGETPTL